MLRNTKDLHDYTIEATDGAVGQVEDFYFDDRAWVVRYLVVDTGNWLLSRKVLVSPMLFSVPDWSTRTLSVTRTREEIKASPDIDTQLPVSRQQEADYLAYYDYPYYWGGTGLWGSAMTPEQLLPGAGGDRSAQTDLSARAVPAVPRQGDGEDPHLRSCDAVTGYHIQAIDGEIGHVQGFLLDDRTWAIRYMVIDTSNWWVGHQVLIAPPWIDAVSWPDRTVSVNLTRQAIQAAPAYDPLVQPDRAQELGLYRHYGQSDQWSESTDAPRVAVPI